MTDTESSPAGISYRDEVRRKLVHLSSLWMAAVMLLLPRVFLIFIFGIMLVLSLLCEHAYANGNRKIIKLYDIFFGSMLRQTPRPGQWIISGGPYVFASAFMSILFFPAPAAAGAMAVMLLGDTAAALAGRRWGRHKTYNGKSLEGVAAFIIAGFFGAAAVLAIAGLPWQFYLYAAVGVFPAAAVELFEKQLRIDDNFSIPLVMGTFLSLPFIFG